MICDIEMNVSVLFNEEEDDDDDQFDLNSLSDSIYTSALKLLLLYNTT